MVSNAGANTWWRQEFHSTTELSFEFYWLKMLWLTSIKKYRLTSIGIFIREYTFWLVNFGNFFKWIKKTHNQIDVKKWEQKNNNQKRHKKNRGNIESSPCKQLQVRRWRLYFIYFGGQGQNLPAYTNVLMTISAIYIYVHHGVYAIYQCFGCVWVSLGVVKMTKRELARARTHNQRKLFLWFQYTGENVYATTTFAGQSRI